MRSSKYNSNDDFLAEYREENFSNNQRIEKKYSLNENRKEKKKREKIAKKARKRKKRKWPYIIIILLLLISITTVGGYKFIDSQFDKFNYIDTDDNNLGIDSNIDESLKDYHNIAILGLDTRAGENPKDSRTDSIMIVSLNDKTGDIKIASVLRDTTLLMKDRKGREYLDKATHAHVFGGPENTVTMLNKSLDLNIKKFFVMNWLAVADMVDYMGGVEIDVKKEEIKDLNKAIPETALNTNKEAHLVKSAGKQILDGPQAVSYCRIRQTSGGDPGRTNRTKVVMTALFSKMKSNITKIPDMTDKAFPSITTNMTTMDILKLATKTKLTNINVTKAISYPHSFYGGLINGIWLGVPTTLEKNNETLHKELFEDVKYTPSNQMKKINKKIIKEFGVTKGNDFIE